MKPSLLKRMFVSIAFILISVFLIALLIGRAFLESYFIENKLSELQPQMEIIADDIGTNGYSSTRLSELGFIIKAYDLHSKEMDAFTDQSSLSRKERKLNLPFTEEDIQQAIKPYVSKILSGGQVAIITNLEVFGGDSILIGQPIRSEGHLIGGLFLIKLVSDYSSAQTGFYFTIILTASLALILTLYIIYRVIRSMINPILDMTSSSEAMARGEYGVRVQETGYGELGDLARSLNILTSQLEQNHQASLKLEQVRRDYVANVTHELRTPLASIRAMSETLCDNMLVDEEGKQRFYHSILHESLSLQRLINDMLELSRLQSGSSAIQKVNTSPAQLMERLSTRFTVLAEDMDIRFTITENAYHMPDFFGHEDRIEQVFTILLDNAFKFTEPEGKVTIDANWNDTCIYLSVTDTGMGIDMEDLPYVFERFYKSDKSHAGPGTGLGLSLAKEILTQLNESISVEATGTGTRFIFTLHRSIKS
ncbi:hypothetical protein BK122_24645 [Paenibacillus pabuli]|nr:hypothetical protein BK122_24645 [Paenibacillus pabuli]